MSVNGKFEFIGRADLLELADRFVVPAAAAVVDEVLAAVARWPEFAAAAGVAPHDADRIATDLEAFSPR